MKAQEDVLRELIYYPDPCSVCGKKICINSDTTMVRAEFIGEQGKVEKIICSKCWWINRCS